MKFPEERGALPPSALAGLTPRSIWGEMKPDRTGAVPARGGRLAR